MCGINAVFQVLFKMYICYVLVDISAVGNRCKQYGINIKISYFYHIIILEYHNVILLYHNIKIIKYYNITTLLHYNIKILHCFIRIL